MNYADFKKRYRSMPLIVSRDIQVSDQERQGLRNQLGRWEAKGLIIQLKRGVYLLNEDDRKINPGRAFIANQLYGPSYVSLEYALNHYDLIPEKVVTVTSVTTKKTKIFQNISGKFTYQHLKPEVFRGFRAIRDEAGFSFFMAGPEKAVVDFVYLNLPRFKAGHPEIFEESYRFQNLKGLKASKLKEVASYFRNSKLTRIIEDFCGWMKKGALRD
jgi:predicted transcriptional regulator of viral defense system